MSSAVRLLCSMGCKQEQEMGKQRNWNRRMGLKFLDDQDADLGLAFKGNIPFLKQYIKDQDTPYRYRLKMVSALCILIYDNTPKAVTPASECDQKLREDIIEFLHECIDLFKEDFGFGIDDYVKELVWPQLGLLWPPVHQSTQAEQNNTGLRKGDRIKLMHPDHTHDGQVGEIVDAINDKFIRVRFDDGYETITTKRRLGLLD